MQTKALNKKAAPRRDFRRLIVIVAFVAIFVIAHFVSGGVLLTGSNMLTILTHAIYPSLLAWGMCFIFTAGITDLSVGANLVLSANIGATLAVELGLGYPGLLIGTILSAILLEHITMRMSQNFRLPPWIAALGIALIYEAGVAIYSDVYTQSHAQSVPNLPQSLQFFGSTEGMILLLVVCGVAAYFLFNNTSLGVNVRAVGDNEQVAAAMGIDRKKTVFLGALVGACFIGLAAVQQVSYNTFLKPYTNLSSISNIFRALATFLLANSFSFVASLPIMVFFSSYVVAALFNFLTIMGVPSGTGQNVCLGAVVILCGILSQRGYKGVSK